MNIERVRRPTLAAAAVIFVAAVINGDGLLAVSMVFFAIAMVGSL